MTTLTEAGLRSAADPEVGTCDQTRGHNFRPTDRQMGEQRFSLWVCISCKALACGSIVDRDPCHEPYGHLGRHVSRAGVRWELGDRHPMQRAAVGAYAPHREALAQIGRLLAEVAEMTGDPS